MVVEINLNGVVTNLKQNLTTNSNPNLNMIVNRTPDQVMFGSSRIIRYDTNNKSLMCSVQQDRRWRQLEASGLWGMVHRRDAGGEGGGVVLTWSREVVRKV